MRQDSVFVEFCQQVGFYPNGEGSWSTLNHDITLRDLGPGGEPDPYVIQFKGEFRRRRTLSEVAQVLQWIDEASSLPPLKLRDLPPGMVVDG